MNKKAVLLLVLTMGVAAGAAMVYGYKPHVSRGIASINGSVSYESGSVMVPSEEIKKIKEELSINDCNQLTEEKKTVSNDSQLIIFKINQCERIQGKKVVGYAMKNISNGYEAQIFKNRKNISTDYIQIQNGENTLELEISLNDGQKISKKIKIERY